MFNPKLLTNSFRLLITALVLLSCRTISEFDKTSFPLPSTAIPTRVNAIETKAASSTGPFESVARVNLASDEKILNMVAESAGDVWLITDKRVLRFSHGKLSDYLPKYAGTIMGLDVNHVVWVVSTDGSQVSAWNGTKWSTAGTESGWKSFSVDNRPFPGRWGITSDSAGHIWVTTNEDVRMFDDGKWTIFNLDAIGMSPPENEDKLPETRISFLKSNNSIWAINCSWIGPGPDGGGGARWYDGQSWHGSDSPVARGCTTSIKEDNQGNIWLGLDNNLWRLNIASGKWDSFPAPKPPETNRLGNFTDLALDPTGNPWPELSLCGGASCYVGAVRYNFTGGKWHQIGDAATEESSLYFDAAGQGWVFRSSGVFRVIDNRLESVAELSVLKATASTSGDIWFVGRDNGETLLFTQTATK